LHQVLIKLFVVTFFNWGIKYNVNNTYSTKKQCMKNNKFLRSAIAIVSMSLSMFLTPAYSQENPKLSDAEVASVAVVANQIGY
jgi:hypothetical protein